MVNFGAKLEKIKQSHHNNIWAKYYLNYNALKEILEEYKTISTTKQQVGSKRIGSWASFTNRSGSGSGSGSLRFNYSGGKSGNSGRRVQDPSEEDEVDNDDDEDEDDDDDDGSNLNASQRQQQQQQQQQKAGRDPKLHPITLEFLQLLDGEIEKIVLFFLQEQGKVAEILANLQILIRDLPTTTSSSLLLLPTTNQHQQEQQLKSTTDLEQQNNDALIVETTTKSTMTSLEDQLLQIEQQYFQVGQKLLKLIQFVEVNVQGIRKIIKKHDKTLPPSFKLSTTYLRILDARHKQQQQQQKYNYSTSSTIAGTANNKMKKKPYHLSQVISDSTARGNQIVQPLLQDESLASLIASLQGGVQDLHQQWYEWHQQQQQQQEQLEQEDYNIHNQASSQWIPINDPTYGSSSLDNTKRNNTTGNLTVLLHHQTRNGIEDKGLPFFASSSSTDLNLVSSMDTNEQQSLGTGTLQTRLPFRTWGKHAFVGNGTSTTTSSSSSAIVAGLDLNKLNLTEIQHRPEYVLLQIHAAQRRLVQTNSFVSMLAAPFEIQFPDDNHNRIEEGGEDDDQLDSPDEVLALLQEELDVMVGRTPKQKISDLLNMMSTFLFMTNYYIVAPTSSTYATKLGGNAALASMIIGMTPVAALVSTVLYSWWTSYSYKAALIFASTCSLIGNLLYAAGLPFDSLTLVMLGRLLNGFGSARSINRRYVADVFTREQRTAAAAVFVTFSAMGMAAGPAIASVLHMLTQNSNSLYWQGENSPGTFMFTLWAIYLVFLILFFENPPKKREHALSVPAPAVEMTSEQTPLLSEHERNAQSKTITVETSNETPMWKNVPALMTFLIYFVLKLCLEAVLSSASVLTGFYFGWEGTIMGIYLAILGLLNLPVNLVIAHLSQTYLDRELIIGLIVGMVVGCIATFQYCANTEDYTMIQYILGSIILFVSATALEGPNMSLLSKVLPKSWSRGIFNVGLLATEAGTFGRVVADVVLAGVGRGGLEHLLNRTFGVFTAVTSTCLFLMLYFYEYMEPADQDD